MALMLPDLERFHPDEVVKAEMGSREINVELFHGKGIHRRQGPAIGLLHGWLGQYTSRYIASALAEQGHDVFAFHNEYWQPVMRSKAVHASTKAAAIALRQPNIKYIGHSDAVRPLVSSARYQQQNRQKKLTYKITEVVTADGNGTNGMPVDVLELRKETKGLVRDALKSPHRSVNVLGQSVINFINSPVTSTIQGLLALRYDAEEDINAIKDAGIPVRSEFQNDDHVVRKPIDNREAIILPGSHLTAIIQPDTMIELAS